MNDSASTLFIDSRWQPAAAGNSFSVFNPATLEEVGRAADARRADASAAVDAAFRAFPAWSQTAPRERARRLRDVADRLWAEQEALAEIITLENGKPLAQARIEVGFAAEFFTWFAEEAKRCRGEIVPSNFANKRRLVIRQPLGVVAVISPWNLPLAIVARKVAPVLASGCTCVLKPAEQTPLSAIALFNIFAEAGLPAGVANLVTGLDPEPIGREFIENDRVAKISFTGSIEVGRRLAGGAGERIKPVSLELGGHAPFIVFADADLENAVEQLVASKFRNSGQACLCANRVYVEAPIHDEFCARFTAQAAAMKIGPGHDPEVRIGPMIDRAAFDKVERHVQDALEQGAKCLVGGERAAVTGCERGHFFQPTVLTEVTPKMLIWREETFGPVAPIAVFHDEQEVIRSANATPYGLSGYAFTRDLGRALRMAEALECGILGINDGVTPVPECPFGGVKGSGIGREGGWQGLDECLSTKYVTLSF
jgi:succinate-semialdehyde dehydrogenase / glutarate-semialdehyde dehydrogenase